MATKTGSKTDPALAESDAPGESGLPHFAQGIAFVHGIGQQKCGESLRSFAEELGAWLQQWLTAEPDTDLRVTRDELEQKRPAVGAALSETMITDPRDPTAPAHTVLTICRNGSPDTRVLIAECWWADAFEPPKLSELVIWLTLIAPYLVMAQAATPLRRSLRRLHLPLGWWRKLFIVLRMAPQAAFLLSSVALIPLLVLLLAVILLPALLPIASLKEAARRAATLVVGYLGDAFIITASPVRRDVITNVVQADLEWLSLRCDEIDIVAHSQGAVIAHDALRRHRPPHLKRFVTLGSGIEKLLRLRLLFRNDKATFTKQWLGVIAAAVLVVLSIATASAFATRHVSEGVELAVAATIAATILVIVYGYAFHAVDGYEEAARIPGAGRRFRWFNYYASSDPVPNGPLIDGPRSWITEREVFNYASIVRDHTSYLKNRDQVLPRLASLFFADAINEHRGDTAMLRRARARRRLRTRFLAIGRALVLCAGIAITVALWRSLDAFGHSVTRHLPAFAIRMLRHLFAVLPHSINTAQGRGVIAWVAAWLLAYCLFALLISWWGRLDLRLVISRESPDRLETLYRVLAASMTVVVLTTAITMALAAGFADDYGFGLRLSVRVFGGATALAVLVSFLRGPLWLNEIERRLTDFWLEQAKDERRYEQFRWPSAVTATFSRLRTAGRLADL